MYRQNIPCVQHALPVCLFEPKSGPSNMLDSMVFTSDGCDRAIFLIGRSDKEVDGLRELETIRYN